MIHYTKIDFDDGTADGGEKLATSTIPVVIVNDNAPMVSHDVPNSTSSRNTGEYRCVYIKQFFRKVFYCVSKVI